MLEHLRLKNVGPSAKMEVEFAPRLNLITGDNGLGKSFLLDVAWWALTRKWPHDLNPNLTSGYPARPTDPTKPASIAFRIETKVKSVEYESPYVPRDEAWLPGCETTSERPTASGCDGRSSSTPAPARDGARDSGKSRGRAGPLRFHRSAARAARHR